MADTPNPLAPIKVCWWQGAYWHEAKICTSQHGALKSDYVAPSVYRLDNETVKNLPGGWVGGTTFESVIRAAGAEWVQGTPRRDFRCIRRGVL